MKVVGYDPKYKEDFIEMNRAWISEMFVIEPLDLEELGNIEPMIEDGGNIFYVLDDDGRVMSCGMIAPRDGDWEIMKFATRKEYAGRGAGSVCLRACIDYAREKGVEKILVVSNTKCVQAVHLYRKFGFTEVPVNREKFPYDRANIAFEMELG